MTIILDISLKNSAHNCCYCLDVVGGECTARVVHNAAILVGTMGQDITRIFLIKITLLAWCDVSLIDSDIFIPDKIYKVHFKALLK